MKIQYFILLYCGFCLYHQAAFCQQSFDFEYQEIEVTIFPKEPGVCPNASADVTCIETFDSYQWEIRIRSLPFYSDKARS